MTWQGIWQPIEDAESMVALLLRHPYYSHGQIRHGYLNRDGEWMGVNANGTEAPLNFSPEYFMRLEAIGLVK